jgi:hypothetical protein
MAIYSLNTIPNLDIDSGWTEPESASNANFKPLYPYNDAKQTESGHLFEMDDTPDRERIRLQHGKKLTFLEMHPNGDQVHKVFGDDYEITIKDKLVRVKGKCTIEVLGDYNLKVNGDYNLQVNGDYNLQVAGKTNVRSADDINLSSDNDIQIAASEDELKFGAIRLSAYREVFISSELNVSGSGWIGGALTVETRLDAKVGVSAGHFGFVSVTGGLSVGGFPVAVPGCVLATNVGFFGYSVYTPFLTSIVSTNILGTSVGFYDLLNWAIEYSTHFHLNSGGIGASGMTTNQPMQTC